MHEKIKGQIDEMDFLTEKLALQQAEKNEKQLKIESLEQEMAGVRLTYETLISQKKEYIKKLLQEMLELRNSIQHLVSREVMV